MLWFRQPRYFCYVCGKELKGNLKDYKCDGTGIVDVNFCHYNTNNSEKMFKISSYYCNKC